MACGKEEEEAFECGCGGTVNDTFINSKAIVSYDNPLNEPGAGLLLLKINQWDEFNLDSATWEFFPCDFNVEDRSLIAQDGLVLRVSGQSHFVCTQAKYVGRPLKIDEYTIVE